MDSHEREIVNDAVWQFNEACSMLFELETTGRFPSDLRLGEMRRALVALAELAS